MHNIKDQLGKTVAIGIVRIQLDMQTIQKDLQKYSRDVK